MKKFYTSLSGLLFLGCAALLHANPSSPTVVAGDVSFSTPDAYTLNVTATSDRSIVEWETFSIAGNQTTTFTLPCSSSAILNRVTEESNMSQILGTLSSNGQIYLVNPNGILFGSESVVDTNAFLASTLDCDNTEFLNAGDMTFLGTENTDTYISYYGTITATDGNVFLLSYQVIGSGDIEAAEGTVGIGAGVEITLTPGSEQKIGIVAHTPLLEGLTGLEIGGYIQAVTAELKAQGNLYQLAINHDGWVDAQSDIGAAHVRFTGDGGSVLANGLVTAVNDLLGGQIDVMGQDIEVGASGHLSAVSANGQGLVNVGQAFGGEDPDFVTAQNVLVNGLIDASALYFGAGGQAVIWADDTLTFQGVVNAIGGQYTGDGGVIQAAGLNSYTFTGSYDVSSPTGDPGVFIPITP